MSRRLDKLLMLLAIGFGLFYLTYRVLYTLNLDALWFSIIFLLAEVQGVVMLFLFFFDVWSPRGADPPPPPPGFTVDVFIPTYNEDTSILRKTILGAVGMSYPHKTYVLDDGRRREVEALARELGVEYITRADNTHAKAGNLNNALPQTTGKLVVIFDADHVPLPQFVERTLGFFGDPKLSRAANASSLGCEKPMQLRQ